MEPIQDSIGNRFPLSWKDTLGNLTGYWREMRPYREERLSPCRAACPAGEDIPAYMGLAVKGNYQEAFLTIAEENPLPAVCGRVCFHPCEGGCFRGELDGPVPIHRVERFIGDYGLKNVRFPESNQSAKGSVAVIGSGPAGLSAAYQARRLGHPVTLFESESKLGGLLRYGIPAYRLPRKILNRSLEMILGLGMEVRTEFKLGNQDSWRKLDGFDAVFLALGAHKSIITALPGWETSPRFIGGLEFLKEVNAGRRTPVGKQVVVIGGGNTAIDAARVCRRLGAEVMILYRRSRQEMPAHREEVDAALGEGVILIEQSVPIRFEEGSVGNLKMVGQKTEPRGMDTDGRILYESRRGDEFVLDVDQVIIAIGQGVDSPEYAGPVKFSLKGIAVGQDLRYGGGKYFAGGDIVQGPRRVCDAIAAGKLGALSMHCYLAGMDKMEIWPRLRIGRGNAFSMSEFRKGFGDANPRIEKPVDRIEIKPDLFLKISQPEPPRKFFGEAIRGFSEVIGDVSLEELKKTAGRCFSCGTCTGCDICYQYCPDMSVKKISEGYEINYDYCKGCAICAEECPRGVIHMRAED